MKCEALKPNNVDTPSALNSCAHCYALTLYISYRGNISLRSSGNYEANASEFPEDLENMFHRY